jgi:hypothetical protein
MRIVQEPCLSAITNLLVKLQKSIDEPHASSMRTELASNYLPDFSVASKIKLRACLERSLSLIEVSFYVTIASKVVE